MPCKWWCHPEILRWCKSKQPFTEYDLVYFFFKRPCLLKQILISQKFDGCLHRQNRREFEKKAVLPAF